MASTEKSSVLSTVTKIIFIGGAIVLFLFLAIWVVRSVPKIINGAANISTSFSDSLNGKDDIVVTTNVSVVEPKETFTVSFDYSPSLPGEYYFSYRCEEALIIDIESRTGPKRVLCDTPFRLGENIKMITLIPNISKENIYFDSELKISYKDFENTEEIAFGTTLVTFKNEGDSNTSNNPYDGNLSGSTVTAEPTDNSRSNNSVPTYTYAPKYYGNADLSITNIARTVGESEFVFTVYNQGTNASGNWYFSYTDAENPTRTKISPIQPNLNPGQGLLVRVRFDGQRYEDQNINVHIDSTNSIIESNESNNYSSIRLDGDENRNSRNYNSNDDADLIIQNLEVGRISGSRFIEDDEIYSNDDAAIRFTVKNIGGESTSSWRFEINNTPNDDDYKSSRQSSLRPGESVEFIIEFENPDEGRYNIKIEVDSEDDVDEENERNNDDSEILKVRD